MATCLQCKLYIIELSRFRCLDSFETSPSLPSTSASSSHVTYSQHSVVGGGGGGGPNPGPCEEEDDSGTGQDATEADTSAMVSDQVKKDKKTN